jgi:phosphoribosylamine--glycine ligase
MNSAGDITSAGGRVVYVTAFGSDLNQASQRANAAIGPKGVHFSGMQYRTDIGYRAM